MADTVDLNEITEYFDDEETLQAKCEQLAEMIASSRKGYFFTGAGISCSAGIASFRGPDGVWTRKAQGRAPPKSVRMTQAIPTYAHMAVAELVASGVVPHLVSQNVDGLHRRSGVERDRIAELHGNCYLEVCWACDSEFLRTHDVSERVNGSGRCAECLERVPHFCHCTSRLCPAAGCGARLKDSIIHFGEDLPERDLSDAFKWAKKADLCVVLGSSLRVTPAADCPADTAARGGNLVIVNLQTTPLDDDAALIIHGKTDDVLERVMRILGRHDNVAPFMASQAAIDEANRLGIDPPQEALDRLALLAASTSSSVEDDRVPGYPDTLLIGNTRRRIEGSDNVRWKAFVKPVVGGDPDAPVDNIISSVQFDLHPTFSPSSIVINEPPFEVTRTGWGTFDIDVTVQYSPTTSLPPASFTLPLSFRHRRTEVAHAIE